MLEVSHSNELPPIPSKRYFSIGEVSELCDVKPHVLRYWEQEFAQLEPIKRRGNRRYYQREDVILVREIRNLLYLKGFTIVGARQKLNDQSTDETAVHFDRALIKEMLAELTELKTILEN